LKYKFAAEGTGNFEDTIDTLISSAFAVFHARALQPISKFFNQIGSTPNAMDMRPVGVPPNMPHHCQEKVEKSCNYLEILNLPERDSKIENFMVIPDRLEEDGLTQV